jgi:hypothetical protein
VFAFTFEPWFLRRGGFLPPELGEGFEGQLGVLMLVDYRWSPVGPYRELLFAAGRNLRWRHHLFSITRIYVSTAASAVSGRENWGIPKRTAEFEVIPGKDGAERVVVQRDRLAEVDLTVAPGRGLPLPAASPPLLADDHPVPGRPDLAHSAERPGRAASREAARLPHPAQGLSGRKPGEAGGGVSGAGFPVGVSEAVGEIGIKGPSGFASARER